MSSIKSRITIESYVSGGYGVFIDGKDKVLGVDEFDILREIIDWLRR